MIINQREVSIVPKLEMRQRIQEYGVGIFELAPTKSALKKALKNGYIMVNDRLANSATYITGGETILLSIPDEAGPQSYKLELELVHEDDHLAAINKPAGILVSGNRHKTVTNALDQNLAPSSAPDATTPRSVHRLDFATTGILLVGKTQSAIRALNQMFEEKKIEKNYYAIAIGEMESKGSITSLIDGKESRSDFEVDKTVDSPRFGKLNLVRVRPRTGRRRQIRRHFSSIGNPILGDAEYGKRDLILKGKGLYLHAHSLRFDHPIDQVELYLKAAVPERFRKIFRT